jgi:hypothetical protein
MNENNKRPKLKTHLAETLSVATSLNAVSFGEQSSAERFDSVWKVLLAQSAHKTPERSCAGQTNLWERVSEESFKLRSELAEVRDEIRGLRDHVCHVGWEREKKREKKRGVSLLFFFKHENKKTHP